MRNLLLWLHIVGVGAWLGANLAQLFVAPILDRVGSSAAVEWYKASIQLGQRYYPVAGVVIVATGIGLVLDGPYDWAHAFVSIGFVAVIIGAIAGVAFFGPKGREAVAAHEAGDRSAATAARNQLLTGAALDTAIVVFTIYAMVAKLGV